MELQRDHVVRQPLLQPVTQLALVVNLRRVGLHVDGRLQLHRLIGCADPGDPRVADGGVRVEHALNQVGEDLVAAHLVERYGNGMATVWQRCGNSVITVS